MTIVYRDLLGVVSMAIDEGTTVVFFGGMAYFTSCGVDMSINVSELIEIIGG